MAKWCSPKDIALWAGPWVTEGKAYPVLAEVTKNDRRLFHTILDDGTYAEMSWEGGSMAKNWDEVSGPDNATERK
jgi:predicted HAD superfamily phosphohydrolase